MSKAVQHRKRNEVKKGELLEDVPLVSQQVQQAEEERQEDMKKEVQKHEYQR